MRVVPPRGRAARRRTSRAAHSRLRRQLPGRRDGPGPGRHGAGHPAGSVQPRLLRRAAGTPGDRLGLRRAGLLDALLLRARGGRGARPDRAPAGARARRPLGRVRRARRPQPGHGAGQDEGRVLRARRRLHRPAPQRAGLHRGAVHRRRARRRAHGVHGTQARGEPGRRSQHDVRGDRHRAGRADRRPDAGRGRPGGRLPDPGGRCAPPGRGHRGSSRPRGGPAADGLRRRLRHLLEARGGRGALGHEQPRREAGRGHGVRLGLLRPGPHPDGRARPGHRRPRAAQGVGRHHRLHPRPPAHPGAGGDRGRPGRRHRRRGGRWSRDDVGARRLARRRRPRRRRAHRPGRRHRPGTRPVRRAGPQPAGPRPDRAALPRVRRQLRTIRAGAGRPGRRRPRRRRGGPRAD